MSISLQHKIKKVAAAKERLFALAEECRLCPRDCGARRLAGEKGYCRAPGELKLAAFCVHHGEEPPISGSRGSGTLFFSHCNLGCIFCQNYQISHQGRGRRFTAQQVAQRMLNLEKQGVHNINLVSPTPYLPWILEALEIALGQGLSIPVVYNTHAYEKVEVLQYLEGIIDIYLPDLKYARPQVAAKFSGAKDYPFRARKAVATMLEQVGPLELKEDEPASRGLLVRHLVLPGHWSEGLKVLELLAALHPGIPVALMSQYYPRYRAYKHPPLDRKVHPEEYKAVLKYALELGMENIMVQELKSADTYLPDFRRDDPFG